MIPIEFKVWCEYTLDGEKHTEMAEPENWFLLSQCGKVMSHGPVGRFNPNTEQQHDKLVVLFFTGLKDKKGKKEFHKDIVKHSSGLLGVIEWDKDKAGWCYRWQDGQITYPQKFHDVIDEVIVGNAFEDPKLMEAISKSHDIQHTHDEISNQGSEPARGSGNQENME